MNLSKTFDYITYDLLISEFYDKVLGFFCKTEKKSKSIGPTVAIRFFYQEFLKVLFPYCETYLVTLSLSGLKS